MFTEIILFLLDTVFTLFGMALLLRLWMQLSRLPSRNPVSQGVFQVTDWIVRPLRRIIPGLGGIDWATVFAAYLTAVAFLLCRALARPVLRAGAAPATTRIAAGSLAGVATLAAGGMFDTSIYSPTLMLPVLLPALIALLPAPVPEAARAVRARRGPDAREPATA